MRSDQSTPWGFRLQGGQEFQMPLSMAKVSTYWNYICHYYRLEFLFSKIGYQWIEWISVFTYMQYLNKRNKPFWFAINFQYVIYPSRWIERERKKTYKNCCYFRLFKHIFMFYFDENVFFTIESLCWLPATYIHHQQHTILLLLSIVCDRWPEFRPILGHNTCVRNNGMNKILTNCNSWGKRHQLEREREKEWTTLFKFLKKKS